MKKAFLLILISYALMTSCGPSQEEIKQREKTVADSIAQVYEQKQLKEEEERIRKKEMEEEEKRKQEEYNNRPEVIREKLLQKEQLNPLNYLSARYSLDYKVFSGNDVIKGTIYNSATLATFKDIEVKILCYSKTKSLIKAYSHVVYDYVYPNNSKNFNVQLKSPNGTKTIGIEIINAKAN